MKIALVTGGGRRVGRVIARARAAAGHAVAIAARTQPDLDETALSPVSRLRCDGAERGVDESVARVSG